MTEPRWPGLAAVGCVVLLQLLLPQQMTAHRFGFYSIAIVVSLASAALLVPKWHAALGYATSAVATSVLAYALFALVDGLVQGQALSPKQLLGGALLIWSMNILAFAAWYWRIDAGGPHKRSKHTSYRDGAFLFPQLTLPHQHGE